MSARRLDWRKYPTGWIRKDGLKNFGPKQGPIADQIIALACMTRIIHAANQETGIARVTYDEFEKAITHSRTLIARGLSLLMDCELILREERSIYSIREFDLEQGWAKFPWRGFYPSGSETIQAFETMHLRNRTELDALKLLFLFVEARDNRTNSANITYDGITDRSGISRRHIPAAVGFLVSQQLVFPRSSESKQSEHGVSTSYRLRGIEAYHHEGTVGRAALGENPSVSRE